MVNSLRCIAFLILFLPFTVFAENYYWVKPSGTKTSGTVTNASYGCDQELSNYYGSIQTAEGQMSGGEWMMICDGTYSEAIIVDGIDGSSGNYTIIRAVNDWGVTLNSSSSYGFQVQDNYVIIRGIHTNGGIYFNGVNHVKAFRCSANDSGGSVTMNAGNGTTYALFEECFVYDGSHRYSFYAGGTGTQYIIFRKNLVRTNYSEWGLGFPLADFANYDKSNVYFYNNISIDGLNNISYSGTYRGIKAFKTPNGSGTTHFKGNIVLNFDGPAFFFESGSDNVTIEDTVAWDIAQSDGSATYAVSNNIRYYAPDTSIVHNRLTLGDNSTGNDGIRYATNSSESLKNSIFYSISGGATDNEPTTHQYNYYFNATPPFSLGTGEVDGTDPAANGLKYLIRIEDGSTLKTAGESNGQIGAEIRWQYGQSATTAEEVGARDSTEIGNLSGLLYGETGWNELQNETKLWPYSYEQEFCEKAGAVSYSSNELWSGSPAINGDRGAASDYPSCTSISVSKYIMNYLTPSPLITSADSIDSYIYGENNVGSQGFLIKGGEIR